MKTIQEIIISSRIEKEFEIELDNGDTIMVEKWWCDSDIGGYDHDYNIIDKEKVFDKLSEEDQEKVEEYIAELK